jgi:hypothetical protein
VVPHSAIGFPLSLEFALGTSPIGARAFADEIYEVTESVFLGPVRLALNLATCGGYGDRLEFHQPSDRPAQCLAVRITFFDVGREAQVLQATKM